MARLSWAPPFFNTDQTPLTDLATYRVWSELNGDALAPVDLPNTITGVTISDLAPGRYTFWVTAVDTSGNESPPTPLRYKVVR